MSHQIHKAKKSLGQNFLKSQSVVRDIVKAGEIKKEDVILEIGPGKGVLTEKLLESAGKVIAVEKDDALHGFLSEKFVDAIKNKKLLLVNADILEFDIVETFLTFANGLAEPFDYKDKRMARKTEDLSKSSKMFHYKIIANIPYNITGAILKKFLSANPPSGGQPKTMVLMVQKEVAQRILARDKKESLLSISVKIYGNPSMVAKVPARFFSPAPKVDSAVIKIDNISKDFFTKYDVNEEKFWSLVRSGFAHKRKKLSGNLKEAGFSIDARLGDKRAEELTPGDWIFVYKHCFD